MQLRFIVFAVIGCVVCGAGAALAVAAGGSTNTVLTSTVYPSGTPASPQGMPSSSAAAQLERSSTWQPGDTANTGVTARTSTTYPNATPASPQGMSPAAAAQLENAAPQSSSIGPDMVAHHKNLRAALRLSREIGHRNRVHRTRLH